jgi:hypothetical protein
LRIPYGSAKPAGLAIEIDRGRPLRLSDGPYEFAEPPDLVRLASRAERLEILHEHLRALCGLWDKPAQNFLNFYFRWIADSVASSATLAAQARRSGLFTPEDWSFSALRPLPQAHLGEPPVRVDFAFWTGGALVALALQGAGTPRRQRQEELARVREAGIEVIEIPSASLAPDGDAMRLLPAPLQNFWDGVALPASPFGPEALREIQAG